MKIQYVTALALQAATLLATQAMAWALYEPFDYPVGFTLPGLGKLPGVTWAAAGPTGPDVFVQRGNLSVPGLSPAQGNQIAVRAADAPSVRLPLGFAAASDTVYYSVALRVSDLTGLGTTGDVLLGFNPAVGSSAITPTLVGAGLLMRAAGAGYQIGLCKAVSPPAAWMWDPRVFAVDETVFVVGAYTFADGANNDMARVWINPDPSRFASSDAPGPSLVSGAGADLTRIESFLIHQRAAPRQPALLSIDEVRVGTSWKDVTPRPEIDLVLRVVSPDSIVEEGEPIQIDSVVSNAGPDTATAVRVSVTLPAAATLQSASLEGGSCSVQDSKVICERASLELGASAALHLTLGTDGLLEGRAEEILDLQDEMLLTATAIELDINPGDNHAPGGGHVHPKLDFGDAPEPIYPTLRVSNGARHRLAGPYFAGSAGMQRDPDPDGMPTPNADGDDVLDGNDDEQGVVFLDPIVPGKTVNVQFTVGIGGRVDGWIDFNGGGWTMAPTPDQIFASLIVPAGVSMQSFTVPGGAVVGPTYARFRISNAGGLFFTGYANNGEVQDYRVNIVPENNLIVTTASAPNTVTEGDPILLTSVVSNAGASTATAVRLATALPAGVTLLSASLSGGGCSVQDSNVVCTLASLEAGRGATLQLVLGTERLFAARPNSVFVDMDILTTADLTEADSDLSNNASRSLVRVERAAAVSYVHGKLFYNDMRENGNFAWRQEPDGDHGTGKNYTGSEGSSSVNWLGAMDVTAYLYRIDNIAGAKFPIFLGSTQVLPDGGYVFSYPGSSSIHIAILFALSFASDDRAFVVDDGAGTTYQYWHPDANLTSPYSTSSSSTTVPPNAYFGGTSAAFDNVKHQAAMVFAAMVDVTRVWHLGERWVGYRKVDAEPVPFLLEDYGKVTVHFPTGSVGGGYGKSPTEINIGAPGYDGVAWTKWHNGLLTVHEYGHAMHQRAWESGYGYDGDFSQDWSTNTKEEPFIAFKEAWANLVAAATFNEDGTDHTVDDGSSIYDDISPETGRPYGTFSDGHLYPGNVTWFLNDWDDNYDDKDDDLPAGGDHFTAELYSMWFNLRGMWENASTSARENGLGLYDYLDYYLADRKSIAAVGADEHLRYVDLITDLAAQNGIGYLSELDVDDTGVARHSWSLVSASGFYSQLPRFYQIEAPLYAKGSVTIEVTTSADAVVVLYDDSGNELSRANSAGKGGTEEIVFEGVTAGDTYYVRVGPAEYGATGGYGLTVTFELLLPASLTSAGGELAWLNTGSAVSSPDAQWRTPSMPFLLEVHDHAYIGDSLMGSGDIDSYYFGVPSDWGGSYTFRVNRLSGDVDPVVAVYDAATGARIGFDDNSGSGNDASLTVSLAAATRYIVAVADATGAGTGDVELLVATPVIDDPYKPTLDADGKATPRNVPIMSAVDSRYWKVFAPKAANGQLTVTASPDSAGLDVDVVVFDASGTVLAKATTEGAGATETVAITDIVPEMTYYITVLPRDYASVGNFDLDIEFGILTGSIAGSVFEDADADSVWDSTEPSLSLWRVFLDENNNGTRDAGEPSVLTDASGSYRFSDLELYHSYYVRLEMKDGWENTAPELGYHGEALTHDTPDRSADDFGVYQLSHLSGIVYDDRNRNTTREVGEPVMPLVEVFADLDHDGTRDPDEPSGTTDAVGNYTITGLPAGTYDIRVILLAGTEVSSPSSGAYSVTFTSHENKTGYLFGLYDSRDVSPLRLEKTPAGLKLSWIGDDMILEEASGITGPWMPVPAATKPYVVKTDAPHKFFRLTKPAPAP